MSRLEWLRRVVVLAGVSGAVVVGCSDDVSQGESGAGSDADASVLPSAETLATVERMLAGNAVLSRRVAPSDRAWVSDGSGLRLAPDRWRKAGLDALDVRAGQSAAETVELRLGDDVVRWTRQGAAEDSQAQISTGRLLHAGAFAGADVVVAAGADHFEELILLQTESSPHTFSWRLELPEGWRALRSDTNGGWLLSDGSGTTKLGIAEPIAIDSAGTEKNATMTVTGDMVTVQLDGAGLQYPVVLDPNIYVWDGPLGTGNPPGSRGVGLSFDSSRQRTVQFGGATTTGNGSEVANTYEWDGSSWTLRCPAGSCTTPAGLARAFHSQAYDSVRNRTVVFGGGKGSGYPPNCETWEWNGTGSGVWTLASSGSCGSGRPPARTLAAMAFETSASRTLLFGGADAAYAALGDLWSWNGSTWTQLCTASPCSTSAKPSARFGAAMAYDSDRNRVVLFGGGTLSTDNCDTWEYPSATGTWTLRTSGGCGTTAPPARGAHAMAYDPFRKRVIMAGGAFSGTNNIADTWEFDGAAGTWTKTVANDAAANRRLAGMAFDTTRRRAVVNGGQTSSVDQTTYEYYAYGGSCSAASDCDTGYCVDSVCCTVGSCPTCYDCSGTTGACAAVNGTADAPGCSATTSVCVSGACKLLNGQTCSAGSQCQSNQCFDNTCCNAACGAPCQSCVTGTCTPVTNGDDPGTCSGAQTCDGSGNCKKSIGQPCGGAAECASNLCVDGRCCNSACTTECYSCNVSGSEGTCTAIASGQDTTCTAPSEICNNGTCKLTNGQACSPNGPNGACSSGQCRDGRCCNSACTTECYSCDVAGSEGTCTAIASGQDTTCTAPAEVCSNGSCKLNNAQACSPDGPSTTCLSGWCRDGNCCNNECTTTCYSCALAGSKGICSPIASGEDTGCTSAQGKVCQSGTCKESNGQTCSPDGANSACASGQCSDGRCCNSACSGGCDACSVTAGSSADGTCSIKSKGSTGTGCGNYLCTGSSAACPNSCSVDTDCISTHYCSGGSCVPKITKGGDCSASNECGSGLVCSVDGVCCDSLCDQTCRACRASNKESGADSGQCGEAKAGTNPGSKCVADTVNACGTVAACAPDGTCAFAPFGKSCGPTSCNGTTVSGKICDGTGTCIDQQNAQCTPYVCSAGACTSPCSGDTDCVSTHYCESGTCIPKVDNGTACNAANACKSGFCVDGVCCDSPCGGQCQACAETGSLGQCKTVTGDPRPGKQACAGTGPCKGSCDGGNPTACSFPASATECAPASCSGDVSQPSGYCDGAGSCTTPATKSCLPYSCDASSGTCKSSCTTDTDCGQAAKCDTATGKCAVTVATCKDAFTVLLPNGASESCSPYKCVGGACQQQCSTTNDCAAGYDCQGSQCVAQKDSGAGGTSGAGGGGGGIDVDGGAAAGGAPAKKESADEGGCGCRSVPANDTRGVLWLGLAGALALLRRRRNGRRAAAG